MTVSAASVREFLWIVKESALGTKMTSPVAGTDSIYIRLVDGNSFTGFANNIIEEIPYGGGFAVMAEAVSDHYEAKASIKTKLYPTQAKFLMDFLGSRINSGQTSPWVTTEPPGDLASVTIYHAVMNSNGTFRRKKFTAMKATGGKVEVSRSSTTAMISIECQGGQVFGHTLDGTSDPNSTEFPAPTELSYPTGPYTFRMTAGGLTVGTVRTQYDDVSISFQNAMDGNFFEGSYLTANQFCGRSTTFDANLLLKASPDDRSDFDAITAKTAQIVFSNGVTSQNMTLQFNGNNHISALPYDLPLDKVFRTKLTLRNKWDPTAAAGAGQDFSVSFA